MRREFSKSVKLSAWERCGGFCERCTAKLYPGKFDYDHRIPDALGGEPSLDNCVVLCRACHSAKTTKADIPAIARAKRIYAKHIGAKAPSRNPMPGSRASKWKRKMDGSVVLRGAE